MKIKPKAIVLVSGGLDSRIVCKIMKEQVNIEAITFILPFSGGCCNKHCAFNFLQKEKIKTKVIDCSSGKNLQDYLKIIRKPKFGYGKGMNPCIDCRIFMLKKAKQYADKKKIEIIATGEVVDERPMSQKRKILKIIESESGLNGRLLRPLSAKLLDETNAEKKGILKRDKFFSICGRRRGKQIELAKKYHISYPNPAGGCLLCEREFCKKLKPMINKKIGYWDIKLLEIGRHFNNGEIILGKNKEENEIIRRIKKKTKNWCLLIPKQPGPTALIKNISYKNYAENLIKKYSKKKIKEIRLIM